jgi:hypothetical protein
MDNGKKHVYKLGIPSGKMLRKITVFDTEIIELYYWAVFHS